MFGLGPTEIIIILVIVLVLFGGKKIPELMRGLGQGMREFKKAAQENLEEKSQTEQPAKPEEWYAGDSRRPQ